MIRSEFVRRLVLDSICDDFENIDQMILRDVSAVGFKCGLTIARQEIVQALASLIADGLAKAYYSPGPERSPFSGEVAGMPPTDVVEEDFRTYFYATKDGIDLQVADGTWWPLDDDGIVRKDWSLAQ